MRLSILSLALFLLCIYHIKADHYAVLVCGSNFYFNYRHQADIYHAYQVLIGYGIPASNIITFAYDDIADNPSNPFPGQVFNKPSEGPGKDVYAGVVIDYSGDDVTPENFLNALKGDSAATGGKKVLTSTADDHVFIFFADHGGPGVLAFPNDELYADDLVDTLKYMNENQKYKQMVFYIEACEAGSMFEGLLPDNINIYATTASNPDESSWATYCNPNNVVNGTSLITCMGDLYSISFLENLESIDPTLEDFQTQFELIANRTYTSHVTQYGQLDITTQAVGDFEADGNSHTPLESQKEDKKGPLVNSRAVKLDYLLSQYQRKPSEKALGELQEEVDSIDKLDATFNSLKTQLKLDVSQKVKDIDFKCLKQRMHMYKDMCGRLSDYGLQYAKYIHFSCVQNTDIYDFERILATHC